MNKIRYLWGRAAMLAASLLSTIAASAASDPATLSNGGTRYDLSAQALANMTEKVVLTMGYVTGVLYAVASLVAIYNATVIYVKIQAGEQGFTKSVLMLIGAILFLLAATIVLPGFFGYHGPNVFTTPGTIEF